MNTLEGRVARPSSLAVLPTRGTIWIDLDNSPHVPFFAPIVDELQRRGFSVVLTARDCFQVPELAARLHLRCKLLGRHSGKNKLRKVVGLCFRALQLIPTVLSARPGLAVSHGSRSQLMVSRCLGIPSLLLDDYEFSTAWVVARPTWQLCPEVIPTAAVGGDSKRVLKYPGIKEDVYVSDFVPDPALRPQQIGRASCR